jgi:hypothetical protein
MDIKLKDANGTHSLDNFFIDEPCVVSFFVGELGWLLQRWHGYLRHLKHNVYPDHKFFIMLNGQYHVIVRDFVSWSIDLPKEFYNLNLETDCYEAPIPESPAGSLTPPEIWCNLIEYMRQFYNPEKAEEIWTPRGVNTWIDMQPQLFTKFNTEALATAAKPIITVFPRGRSRAAERNVPENVWFDAVEALRQQFAVVLCGTPSGSFLVDYEAPGVDNLIGKADLEKVMYLLNNSAFSISSQSGPTHISLLSMCPAYIIGHEQQRHTVDDNRFNTPTSFRYVADYRAIDGRTIVQDVLEFLQLLQQHGESNHIARRLVKPTTQYIATYRNKDVVGAFVGYKDPKTIGNAINLLDIKKVYLVGKLPEDPEFLQSLTDSLDEYNKHDKVNWISTDINEGADEIKEELDFVYIDDLNVTNEEINKYFDKLKAGGVLGGGDEVEYQKRGFPLPFRKIYEGVEADLYHKYDNKAPLTGWYTMKGGLLRDSMIPLRDKKNLIGAEIGIFYGCNSKGILDNLDIKKLYLIDPYDSGLVGIEDKRAPIYIQNSAHRFLSEYSEKIEWIKKKSQDAAKDIPNNLDFAYIDGDHTYEGALGDIKTYWPKLKKGGILGGHDYDNEDVAKAVQDFFKDKENIMIFTGVDIDGTLEFWVYKIDNLYEHVLSEGTQAFSKILKKREKDNG